MLLPEIVGNKAKGRISKRVFQENNARQIFRKNFTVFSSIDFTSYVYNTLIPSEEEL